MKRFSKVLAVAAGFLLGSASMLSAGVVMSETATAIGPNGKGVQRRTIYIQGDKQKVDTEALQTITDLDKRVFYVIDKEKKDYVEMPLASVSNSLPGRDSGPATTITLERTGKSRMIASSRCDEYRGGESNGHVQLTVSACVSSSAPGAREVARFDRKMVERMAGVQKPAASGKDAAGVVLQKKSVLSLKLPDPAKKGYRTASVVTKTTVDRISVRQLAEETFIPPKGFNRLQNKPAKPGELPASSEVQSVVFQQGATAAPAYNL
jgi:hypothetical protein